MKTSVLVWGFMVACVVAFTGCGDNAGHPPAQTKELVTFGFLVANNPGLTANASATISDDTISATVPFGTNVTALVATFDSTGASVTVGGVAQVSGMTANNFSSSLSYQVTAADSTTRAYTVTVTVAPSSARQLSTFAFLAANNAGLGNDVTATINGSTIAATVPFGTSVTALVATFTTNGASVTVAGTAQVSGTTANNFTSPVTYRVTAADASTQDYTVTVTVASSSAKAITTYAFLSVNNPGLTADVTATINGTAIAATVPFGTNVTGLVATFTTTGTSVDVGGTAQVSNVTANNFATSVDYTVTAADTTTAVFTVTVNVAQNPAKAITAYAFLSVKNPALTADVTATINGTTITANVPFGTDVTALIATFSTTGMSVAVGGTAQVSDVTPNNFTSPVIYRVTAADNSTLDHTVTVNVAPSPAKDITAYAFLSAKNPGLPADVIATVAGTSITATVPFGTDVTALIATFSTTGMSVAVGGTAQVSDVTPNNFTSPVIYRVTAADNSTLDHTVAITVAPSPAKDITAYAFLSANNPGLTANVTATINGTAITATVPFATDLTNLVATFTTTGTSVAVTGTPQVSGMTANDFTTPVAYTVTAADGTMAVFTVTVAVATAPKDLTAYSFLTANNAGLATNVTATITGTAITAVVPPGTTITALVATFTTTGASVTVGGITQVSGTTANNFTTPVVYRVTGLDNLTQDFTVTVRVAALVTGFSFTGALGNEATFPADVVDPGLASVPLMGRAGGAVTTAANVFIGTGWNTTTLNLAHYYTFTLTPAAGKTMTLTNFAFKDQRSGSGPMTFTVRSSRDNFATDLQTQATHTALTVNTFTLDASFADLATAVEFRLYAFGTNTAGGTWRLDDVQVTGVIVP